MAEAKTQSSPTKIERKKTVLQRLAVGLSHLDENLILRKADEPNVSGVVRTDGSPIPRLKLVPLGACAVGFYSADVDQLIEALRDSKRIEVWPPGRPKKKQPHRPSVKSLVPGRCADDRCLHQCC